MPVKYIYCPNLIDHLILLDIGNRKIYFDIENLLPITMIICQNFSHINFQCIGGQ